MLLLRVFFTIRDVLNLFAEVSIYIIIYIYICNDHLIAGVICAECLSSAICYVCCTMQAQPFASCRRASTAQKIASDALLKAWICSVALLKVEWNPWGKSGVLNSIKWVIITINFHKALKSMTTLVLNYLLLLVISLGHRDPRQHLLQGQRAPCLKGLVESYSFTRSTCQHVNQENNPNKDNIYSFIMFNFMCLCASSDRFQIVSGYFLAVSNQARLIFLVTAEIEIRRHGSCQMESNAVSTILITQTG